MNAYLKSLAALVVAVFFFASIPAQAVTVNFDYLVPGDVSGKTSPVGIYLPTNTALPAYFIETFDKPNTTLGAGGDGLFNLTNGGSVLISSGGGFSSLNEATDLWVTGTIGIRKNLDPGVGAPPAGDVTNFAYAPGPGGPVNTTVLVDYAADIAANPGLKITSLGLYYGSIDWYNSIAFYSGSSLITGPGVMSGGIIEGSELINLIPNSGCVSGDQDNPCTNVYVNLLFDENEIFTSFKLINTYAAAFEVDNIVIGFNFPYNVPEPATMMLLGLGLVGLAGIRRKLKK